ncbi:MTSS1 [Lepeophtheirus salmonis]|uniref:MTSS1 n=1 Tax=Lepeophtheirus salmonis TaxID=72036 RepID=A0A7R8CSA9_LEPSM|nr:MTSS1 [Lepeophtheirus salmonis]CAF2875452.1 MTSS1 [Lepeophtheirus salmonis]
MKNGAPIFDEFVSRAGKLHTTLKNTIFVLGSFLDSFQKIADAASNTKGATRDIGTCLTRIVMRHRALESRMKTLAGALMDCLHSKGYKKSRSQIKKKSDQVQRLKKKLKKEKVADPSVKRLFDQCSKDLNAQFKTFENTERTAVRKALSEDRNRYCTFVAFLKPVLDEEIAMFTEIHQIEEILSKLNRTASLKESTEIFIEDFVQKGVRGKEGENGGSICLATPPSTPSSSMGSRKGSMSSLDSGGSTGTSNSSVSISINGSPTQRSIQSGSDYEAYTATKNESLSTRPSSSLSHQKFTLSNPIGDIARPMSSTSWDGAHQVRPRTISTSYDKRTQRPVVTGTTFASNHVESGNNTDSETYSPFHRISDSHTLMKRPPLPQRCSSADRSITSTSFHGAYVRCASIDRASSHHNKPMVSLDNGPHYAIPKPTLNLTMVPNFHSDKRDMVIPHPVYMNCKDLDKMKNSKPTNTALNDGSVNGTINETVSPKSEQEGDDLKTPTVEELSFPGKKVTGSAEDGSSSSSGSIGSSSGYGSQCTIKFDENMPQCSIEGQSTPLSSPPHVHQNHQESYHHPNFLENRQFISNIMTLKRRSLSLRRNNDSSVQGCNLSPSHNTTMNNLGIHRSNSHSCDVKPPPPMRRSSIGNKDSLSPNEDDTTPRGSVEDLPPMMANQEPLSILRRSTSMTGPPVQIIERNDRFRRSYQPGEKSSLFSTLSSKLNQRLKIEERPDPYILKLKSKSPDAEDKYGFGMQFQSTRQDYFIKSTRDVKDNINAKLRINPNSSNGA